VMGRGRLQPPSRGVDAMLQFVRERVLPQDQVAVLAWDRATDFTTNHAGIAELLERFKAQHEKIETDLFEWFYGLRAMYGDKKLPPHIQKQVDAVFDVPTLRAAHTLVKDPNQRTTTTDELKKRADALQRAEMIAERPADKTMTDAIDPVSAMGIEGSLEQFMANMMTVNQDLSNLYAGIEYLRFIEGEKHVVFVTETGIGLPDFSTEMSLAAVANNARVVIDTIQTGGASGDGLPSAATRSNGIAGMSFAPMFALQSMRNLSNQTGGVTSIYAYADKAVKRIDEATRFSYLLGYYATNGEQDGRYRQVSVTVKRPGAQVLYRHGYFAKPQTMPANRRDMMSYTRMSNAFTTGIDVLDIPISFKTHDFVDGGKRFLDMDITIALAKLAPVSASTGREYIMELAIVCANQDQKPVGQYSDRLNFTLTQEQYDKAVKDGLPMNISVRVPVTSFPMHAKVVVYNFENDLLGSVARKIR